MNNGLRLEMCFIGEGSNTIKQQVESELNVWFSAPFQWFVHSREENDLDVVTAEIRGQGNWQSEDELLDYVEESFAPELLEHVYGYCVQLEKKGCCGCGKT